LFCSFDSLRTSTASFTPDNPCEHKTFNDESHFQAPIFPTLWRSNLSRYHTRSALRICACPNNDGFAARSQGAILAASWPIGRAIDVLTMLDI
jgi:hypothetical protein